MKIDIVSRWDSTILFTAEAASLLLVLRAAIKCGANLFGANLSGADLGGANLSVANLSVANLRGADLGGADLSVANLRGANLSGADLGGANLFGADLGGVNLRGADLGGANLRGANLSGANLRGANLFGADLRGANFRGANLRGANLPSPTTVLLAYWGCLSDTLTADLMEYDASNHPDRAAFDRWVEGGPCPYEGVRIQRAAQFSENPAVWGQGTLKSAYTLMLEIFKEAKVKF